MEVTTLSNLVALAINISALKTDEDANFSEDQFDKLLDDIYDRIEMLSKWDRNGVYGELNNRQ